MIKNITVQKMNQENDIAIYQELTYISKILQSEIIRRNYNTSINKYFKTNEIMKQILRNYYWSEIWIDVQKYIQDCKICE